MTDFMRSRNLEEDMFGSGWTALDCMDPSKKLMQEYNIVAGITIKDE